MLRLHSLLLVEEKLLEAKYFMDRLPYLTLEEFGYELNAFLSAARSVTFLLQKEMRKVPGFSGWWNSRVSEMREDLVMQFFKNVRNFSQKEGSAYMYATASLSFGRAGTPTYRFAQHETSVPSQLANRDVVECCREHLGKLATVILAYADAFPLYSCPRRAVTVEGLKELRLELSDIEKVLGFPNGWTDVQDVPHEERVRILQRHFDGVDFQLIRAISQYDPRPRPG